MRFSAYGLSVQSPFSVPGLGVAPPADDLPEVCLRLESPEDCVAAWSGPAAAPWRGWLGDGCELTIEWGVEGDLLFGYGDRARFLLDPGGARLGCGPRDQGAADWRRVLVTRVLPNVSIAHGREALHASAVETPLGVVALAAPSGTGKSTLAVELVRRGWPLFADDSLILEAAGKAVIAHPGAACTSLALDGPQADAAPAVGSQIATLAGESWVAVAGAARAPRPVAAIVLLERRPGLALEVQAVPAQPLALAPYMLGLPDQAGRDGRRFDLYSDLVASAKLLRLQGDVGDSPGDLAEALEQKLGLGATALRGAA